MESVERIILVVLVAAILSVMAVTLMMLFELGGVDAGAFEGAALVSAMTGGAA